MLEVFRESGFPFEIRSEPGVVIVELPTSWTPAALERFDLKALGPDSATAWHLIGESMRLAYADREAYLGDPDYVRVPVASGHASVPNLALHFHAGLGFQSLPHSPHAEVATP